MIAIDIDGVIANTEPWLRKEIEERAGIELEFENPRTFRFGINIEDSDCNEYINDALIKYKDDIHVHDMVRTNYALRMLDYKYGIVYFITARPNGDVAKATNYWIKKKFPWLNFESFFLGECADKKEWMRERGFHTIIEDRLKTANEVCFDDGNTFLINRAWNKGRKTESHVIRVNDLLEAVDICTNTEER